MEADVIEIYRRTALLLHLTDEELVGRLEDTLEGLTSLRVAAHLRRCSVCQGRLEFLQSILTADVIAFPDRRSRLGEALNVASFQIDPVLAKAALTMSGKDFKDAEGWFYGRMYERNDGTLSISIASHATEEAGSIVDLFSDQMPGWQRTETFKLEGEEIVARFVLTLEDRRQLPRACQLRCRLRHPDAEPSE